MRPQVIKLIRILDSEGNQVFQEDGITPLLIPMDEEDYLCLIENGREYNPALSDQEILSKILSAHIRKVITEKQNLK